MKPNDKPFNREDYKEFDGPAKEVAIEWLTQYGFGDVQENYGESQGNFKKIFDVAGYDKKNKRQIAIEAEVKKDWGTKWTPNLWEDREYPFNWPTMDIPYRKRKVKTHLPDTQNYHMVVGGDYKRLFIIRRDIVVNSKVSEKWCRNRSGMEPFYNIKLPAEHSFWFERNESGKWTVVKNKTTAFSYLN